jgi:octaprenyl-diphosphate synthase
MSISLPALLALDFAKFEHALCSSFYSRHPVLQEVSAYLLEAGGKRLRPLLLLLCTRAAATTVGEAHLQLAVAVELIHNATLLHDDIIDASLLRRGRPTSNQRWGNQVAVLAGDFLYSRALQLIVGVGQTEIMRIMANVTNDLAEGEMMQLSGDASYLEIISKKTANLFRATAEAVIVLDPTIAPAIAEALVCYAFNFGMLFQICDDIHDAHEDPAPLDSSQHYQLLQQYQASCQTAIAALPNSVYSIYMQQLISHIVSGVSATNTEEVICQNS